MKGGENMKISKMLAVILSMLLALTMASVSFAGGKMKACPKCGKEVQTENGRFYVVYTDGKKESFGCPHCGLSEINAGKVKSAMATDFLRGKKIDAEKAFYLKGTEFGTCCAPYWLSFSSKDEAEKFSKGFGGKVLSYEEALKEPEVQP